MADDSSEIVKEAAETVAFTNVKTVGEAAAFYTAQAMKQSVDAGAGWTTINQAIVGKIAESIINVSPGEGGADIAALAQLAKLVQGTPPPTNIPTQGG